MSGTYILFGQTLSIEQLGLIVSVSFFLFLAALEAIFPRKNPVMLKTRRWLTNIAMIIVDSVAVRLMGPIVAMGAAMYAAQNGIGLFNWTELPAWLEFVMALIALDLAIYTQHVITHKVPFLWAFHKVHHADRDIDVTTAVRFHPIEIVLSMLYKCGVVLLFGPSVLTVLIFALILNLCAMFNHANLRLPGRLDQVVRILLVTPDMHRVHHSTIPEETNSNYGFSIALWDRLFRTYKAQPDAGHDELVIGLPEYQSVHPSGLWWSLILPFQKTRNFSEKHSSENSSA